MKKRTFFITVLTLLLLATVFYVVKIYWHNHKFPSYLSVTCANKMLIFFFNIYEYREENGHFPVLNDGKWKRECFEKYINSHVPCLCPIFDAYVDSAAERVMDVKEPLTHFVGLQLPIACRNDNVFVVVHSRDAVPLSADDIDYHDWCRTDDTEYSHKEVMVIIDEKFALLSNAELKSIVNASSNANEFLKKAKRKIRPPR